MNGKEIPIFKAAPHLMLIESMGEIKFRYRPRMIENLTLILSGISLLGVALTYFRIRRPQPPRLVP